jgi:hypothetical protein
MQVIEKYIIIALLIVIPTVFSLGESKNLIRPAKKLSNSTISIDNKRTSEKVLNAKPNTETAIETDDSLKMNSKIWMFNQNIIIGY